MQAEAPPWLIGPAVGLLVAATVGTALGLDPGAPGTNRSVGDEHRLRLPHGNATSRTLDWSTPLHLDEATETSDVEIAVPYTVRPSSPDAVGARVELVLSLNGQTAYQHLLHPGPGVVTQTLPLSQFDAAPLEPGSNRVAATLHVERSPDHAGSARLTAGPLVVRSPADPSAGAELDEPTGPAGLAAGLAGLAAGTGAGLLVHRTRDGEGRR